MRSRRTSWSRSWCCASRRSTPTSSPSATNLAKEQLATRAEASRAQLAVQQSNVDQARAVLQLSDSSDELKVRAGLTGMLQLVPVEVGQQVAPGANLARVANPGRLKAEIEDRGDPGQGRPDRPEGGRSTRATVSSTAGWPGSIRQCRTGPVTVDVSLEGELPKRRVPDLSVDGTIELERLDDVLYMGRPAFGQEQSTVGIFKVDDGDRR